MGCSSSSVANGSRENVRESTRTSTIQQKDSKPQAAISPTSRDETQQKFSIQSNNRVNVEPATKSPSHAITTGSTQPSQSVNPASTTTAGTQSSKKALGPNVLPKLPNVADEVKNLLHGRHQGMSCQTEYKPSLITFYHCACATDSTCERDVLFEKVYPSLRQHCVENGCELEVVDLNWRTSTDSYHQVERLCWQEMEACRNSSLKTIYVIFLNEKYGSSECPLSIKASDFESTSNSIPDEVQKSLLSQFYKLDQNAVPAEYKLQCAKELSLDEKEWLEKSEMVKKALQDHMTEEMQKTYLTSVLDKQITHGILEQGLPASDIILLSRTLTNFPEDTTQPLVRDYSDTLCLETDQASKEKLKALKSCVKSKVVSENILKFETSWKNSVGIDVTGDHVTYLQDVSTKFKDLSMKLISDVVKEKREQDKQLCGIAPSLYKLLLQQELIIQSLNDSFQGRSELLGKIYNYLLYGHVCEEPGTRFPLVLHGKCGSGKSSISAAVIKECHNIPGWNMGICVARFVGLTPVPKCSQGIIQSLGFQIDAVYGLSLTSTSKNYKQFSSALKDVFTSQPQQHPLLIIVDGFDRLVDSDNVDWLPDTLPPSVRIILTTSSDHTVSMKALKAKIPDNKYFLEIPSLNEDESSAILGNILNLHNSALTSSQKEDIGKQIHQASLPMYVTTAAKMAVDIPSYAATSEITLKKDVKSVIKSYLEQIEMRYTPGFVSCVLSLLCNSRDGLSDGEIMDLIGSDKSATEVLKSSACAHPERLYWPLVRMKLEPFLTRYIVNNNWIYSVRHQVITDIILDKYSNPQAVKTMLSYFSNECVNDNLLHKQAEMFGDSYNMRRFSEVPYLLLANKETEKFKELLFNYDWLVKRLSNGDVFGLLHEVSLLCQVDANCKDLEVLHKVLCQSASVLRFHPNQLPIKLHLGVQSELSTGNYPLLKKLCGKLSGDFLIPSKSFSENSDVIDDVHKTILTGLFRIPSCPTHVASVATEKGEVKVWDMGNDKMLRSITGVSAPRNIKMINEHKAAILCNRELKVYNLDTGTLESKLKGVLNVKMPFYGIHDADHVVALSRNRMYVNIMNTNTGDMDATFKVGEDRFLNSLLVSKNGETCVCGDEVQKPFPLLVWDLPKRKLIHDLRIAQHEFLPNMSAITNDGHYVVCVCKELDDPAPNFIIVYDIQSGQLFKKWKPDYNTTAINISSESNLVVSASEDASITVWDMVSGSSKWELFGHCMPVDTIRLSDDGLRAATYDSTGKDTSIHLWDLAVGKCVGVFSPDDPVTCCEISAEGTAVIIGLPGMEQIVTLRPGNLKTNFKPTEITNYGDPSRNGQTFDLSKAG